MTLDAFGTDTFCGDLPFSDVAFVIRVLGVISRTKFFKEGRL